MSEYDDERDSLRAALDAIQIEAEGAKTVVLEFTRELATLRGEMMFTDREVRGLSRSFGSGLRKAFDGVVFDGMKLSDALSQVGRSMVNSAYSAAIRPVQNALGGAIAGGLNSVLSGVSLFENGGSFSQGRTMPIAGGGVANRPTAFPMRGGAGLMGEAGPEAIMPLSRGADGKLGVRMEGQARAPVTVVMNISTPDAQGFRRSQSQIASEMGRALGRGQRNR
jgi:hypothetical protein